MSADSNSTKSPNRFIDGQKVTPWELALVAATTALLLIPCFWTGHIQAGDLSSHVYNAWLATQIEAGLAPGLTVTHPWTNMLSDVALQALLRSISPVAAERIVVCSAVLIFYWGVFALVTAATGRRPWLLAPSIGMITYGLVFHLGFLNFYLAAGLCLWALALLWQPTKPRAIAAVVLTVLAIFAHALAFAWAAAVLIYVYIARRFSPAHVKWMLVAGAVLVALTQIALMNLFPSRGSLGMPDLSAWAGFTGVEQVWLFGSRYMIVAAGLLFLWAVLFLQRIDRGKFLSDPIAQLWLLHLLAFVLLPSAIQLPHYQHVFAYIPQRISLLAVVCFFMMIGGASYGRGITRGSSLVATVFFLFLYLDDRAFNSLENELMNLVQTVPAGTRVIGSIEDPDTRLNPALHSLDRACIGHCFSYADYEPATGQFRIRIVGPTRVVAPNMEVVQDIENGNHVVTAQEAPLYSVCLSENQASRFYLRPLRAGEKMCKIAIAISPRVQY